MLEGIGRAFELLYRFAVLSTVVAWPLALWKLFDIAAWLFAHVSINWQ